MNKGDTVIFLPSATTDPFQSKTTNGRFTTISKPKIWAAVVCLVVIFVLVTRNQPYTPDENDVGRYRYQETYKQYTRDSTKYLFAVISDMDKKSKVEDKNLWMGILKTGILTRNSDRKYSITWTDDRKVTSQYNEGGRGMELSELVYYHNRLLTCDDRTGLIFEITDANKAIPLHVLSAGNGKQEKGMKCEWMTVKNDKLFVGSIGKEFVMNKEVVNNDNTWVKVIDTEGKVKHVPWDSNYDILRKTVGAEYPGYLLHEAVNWNSKTNKWMFMPRRFSTDAYDEEVDEQKGTNMILTASEDFSVISQNSVGTLDPLRGVSSFKFIPFREGEVVALKTVEFKDRIESFITVYNLDSLEVLMDDVKIDNIKFEGVEFI